MNENIATKNNKKIIAIGIILTAIVILSSIAVYNSVIKPQKYSEYLNLGNKYLLEQNYEEAILAFEKAIKIDEKSTEARLGVAKAYIGINDVDNATLYLEQAQNLDKTNENILKEIIDILINIDSEVAYEFLDKFINEVGEGNISEYINDLINESKEVPNDVKVSPSPGKYIKPISIKLDLDKMKIGHSYYYTLDGSNPTKNSNKYLGKIDIKESTTIKLIGYNKNNESTEVLTLKYIIDKNIIKDIKSSITDGENLIKNTTVGTEVGNISKEDKGKLQIIISEAKELLNKDSSNYNSVNKINIKLEDGIIEFKENIIKPVDKTKLKVVIDNAEKLYANAIEGTNVGQYKLGSKNKLNIEINNAKEIYNNKLSKQNKVDNATSSLNSAINSFKNNKVTQANQNPDGTYTRQYVKQYYINKVTPELREMLGENLIDVVVNVLGSQYDHIHNNTVHYGITYYPIASIVGDGVGLDCVNAKTLKKYSGTCSNSPM